MFNRLNEDVKKLFPSWLTGGLAIAAAGLLLVVSPGVADAKPKKLPAGEAVLQARITMGDWSLERELSYPDKARCVRKSRVRFRCSATVTGEFDRYVRSCDLVAIVVNRYRRLNYGGYWESVGKLTQKKCRSTKKPFLADSAGRAALVAEGNRVAGQETELIWFFRNSNTEVQGRVQWSQQGEFGVETCDVYVSARLVSGKVRTSNDGSSCGARWLVLTEEDARAAVQAQAQQQLGQTVGFRSIFQDNSSTWSGSLIWGEGGDPWDPIFECDADFIAERTGPTSISVAITGDYCYIA